MECCVINAYQKKVLGKHKTDIRDARDLATWGQFNMVSASYVPSMAVHELRQLVRTRASLLEHRTAVINQLKALLEGQCPGITRVLDRPGGKYVQLYLSAWKEGCQIIPFRVWLEKQKNGGTKKALKKRADILEYWWEHPLPLAVQYLVDYQLRQYLFYCGEIAGIERIIRTKVDEAGLTDAVKLMNTVPGLGFITCVTVACELGSSTRFSSAREAAASCGLTPRLHGSAA